MLGWILENFFSHWVILPNLKTNKGRIVLPQLCQALLTPMGGLSFSEKKWRIGLRVNRGGRRQEQEERVEGKLRSGCNINLKF